jgi:hypothetical protein
MASDVLKPLLKMDHDQDTFWYIKGSVMKSHRMPASHYYRVRLHGDFSAVRLQGCWAFFQAQLRSGSSEGLEVPRQQMGAAVGSAEEVEMSAVGLAVVEMAAGLAALGGGGDGQMAAGLKTA